jgi:chromosome segregation ATPase
MNDNPIRDTLIFELTRNNQGILSDLKEANKTIAQLRLEILHIKNNQFELAQQLENATNKITQLLLNLEDSTTEIARLTHLLNNNDG